LDTTLTHLVQKFVDEDDPPVFKLGRDDSGEELHFVRLLLSAVRRRFDKVDRVGSCEASAKVGDEDEGALENPAQHNLLAKKLRVQHVCHLLHSGVHLPWSCMVPIGVGTHGTQTQWIIVSVSVINSH